MMLVFIWISVFALHATALISRQPGPLYAGTDHDGRGVLQYEGRRAASNWSMEWSMESNDAGQLHEVVLDDFSNDTIPVFVGDYHDQMERMVLDWSHIKDSYNLKVAMRGVLWDTATMKADNGISDAFAIIENTSPRVAVWLLSYSLGSDPHHTLKQLAAFFKRTSGSTQHIVFHWGPEFCDQADLDIELVKKAYEHAAVVFQFAYQDDRLTSFDPNKYKPWPLGPAWWRGWHTPTEVPHGKRDKLLSFRGSSNTHPELSQLQHMFQGRDDIFIQSSGQWTGTVKDTDKASYKDLLETSAYGLNLAGHNPNCYRIIETVESGTIPVILAKEGLHKCYDNWTAQYGLPLGTKAKHDWIPKAPFEVIEDWGQLNARLPDMERNAEKRSHDLQIWYRQWRQAFHDQFRKELVNALGHQPLLGKTRSRSRWSRTKNAR